MLKKTSVAKGKAKSKTLTRKVQFEFPAPEAKEVYLVGNFNNWDASANPMKKDKILH
jgi:1,4-alpha-glucan branching enzyme